MRGRKLRVQYNRERNVQFLEYAADAREAPVDPVLAEGLIHQVRIAVRQVRPKNRPLAETELLDKQGEADGDLFAPGPGGDVDRLTTGPVTGSLPSCAKAAEAK